MLTVTMVREAPSLKYQSWLRDQDPQKARNEKLIHPGRSESAGRSESSERLERIMREMPTNGMMMSARGTSNGYGCLRRRLRVCGRRYVRSSSYVPRGMLMPPYTARVKVQPKFNAAAPTSSTSTPLQNPATDCLNRGHHELPRIRSRKSQAYCSTCRSPYQWRSVRRCAYAQDRAANIQYAVRQNGSVPARDEERAITQSQW